jgi:hypothetical protein
MKRVKIVENEPLVCPRCFGTGNEERTPTPYGVPVAIARKMHAPCAGCGGLGQIPISYYRKLQTYQKLAHKALQAVRA